MSLSDHSAPGSNAGFGYQFERALYWLSRSPAGYVIGIETDDDVAVRGTDGKHVLEQDKHSIQKDGQPFGNRSKDLWNTLAIWMDAIEKREIGPNTAFLMVTNKALVPCIAHEISSADSYAEVIKCVAALEKAAKNPPQSITDLTQRVLRSESRQVLHTIIANCTLSDSTDKSAGADLRTKSITELQIPAWCSKFADSIFDELLGWLHKTALAAWQSRQPAWIQRDNFVNQLHAIIDVRKRQLTRERAENLIPVPTDQVGKQKGRLFVTQLYHITDDDSIVDNAIRELIRCNLEKDRLSREGNITDDDWIAFQTTLLSRWDKIRQRVVRLKKQNPEKDIGFEIFTETTESHCEKLAGNQTEQVYLTAGTYHLLADMVRLGWHPRFKELMNGAKKNHD
jgi:hypothetical protein